MVAFLFLLSVISLYLLTLCSVKAQQQPPLLALNQEYVFNGTKQSVVSLPQLICVKGNNPRAIKFEMKSNQVVLPNKSIQLIATGFNNDVYSCNDKFDVLLVKGKIYLWSCCADIDFTVFSSPALNDNQWHRIALTYDQSKVYLYIDNNYSFSTDRFNRIAGGINSFPLNFATKGDVNTLSSAIPEVVPDLIYYNGNLRNIIFYDYNISRDTALAIPSLPPTYAPSTVVPTLSPSAAPSTVHPTSSSTEAPSVEPSASPSTASLSTAIPTTSSPVDGVSE